MKTSRPEAEEVFDELISGYYGKPGRSDTRTIEEVLASYYGRARREPPPRRPPA